MTFHGWAAKRTFYPLLKAPQARLVPIRTATDRCQRLPILVFGERTAAGGPHITVPGVYGDDGWKWRCCVRCVGLKGTLREEAAVRFEETRFLRDRYVPKHLLFGSHTPAVDFLFAFT